MLIFRKYINETPNTTEMNNLTLTQGIVYLPSAGLCNRLRCLASCAILANELNVPLYVNWNPEECCNITIERVITSPTWPQKPIQEIKNTAYLYNPNIHTTKLLYDIEQRGEHRIIDYLIVQGGHEFHLPFKPAPVFMSEKQAFYNSLVWTTKVPPCKFDIGIHLRIYIDKYDRADVYDFQNDTQMPVLEKYVTTLLEKNDQLTFYLACNVTQQAKDFQAKFPHNVFLYEQCIQDESVGKDDRADAVAMERAIREFQILANTTVILGTHRSSFSDEACFLGNLTTKVCLSQKPTEEPYHIEGYGSIHGIPMVLPDARVACMLATSATPKKAPSDSPHGTK